MLTNHRMLGLTFVTLVVLGFMGLWQSQLHAPDVQGLTPFDRQQALETLKDLVPEDAPHPVGSQENKRVRDQIVAKFTNMGYAPEIQSALQCAPPPYSGTCAQLDNIVAVLKGASGRGAVLVTAHYDSVPAGPGIGDDLAGTAVVLELAKYLKTQSTPKNDVIFLITDAEEVGLLGAAAFAQRNPLYKTVKTVVNFEARGASGPSNMFETGPGNLARIELLAKTLKRPVADSVAYEIYKLLPNDTDFSIYRKDGLGGFNFAFTGAASRYHSPTDNLALLDRASLQHHGDNAFALVGALKDADLDSLNAKDDASYFDVFGARLIAWPSSYNLPVAIMAFLGVVLLIAMNWSVITVRSSLWSVAAIFGTPAVLFGLGWALSFPLGIWPGAHPLDHAAPLAGRLALTFALIFVPTLIASLLTLPAPGRRASPQLVTLGIWKTIAAMSIACAYFLPGATHAFVGPVFAFVVVALLSRAAGYRSLAPAAIAGFVVAAFFWLSYFTAIEVVFGFAMAEARLLVGTILALAILALLFHAFAGEERGARTSVMAATLVVVGCTIWASLSPPYSADHPRAMNLIYYQGGSPNETAMILTGSGPLDRHYVSAQGFASPPDFVKELALIWGPAASKPKTSLNLAAPSWQETGRETKDGVLTVSGTLKAARSGLALVIIASPEIKTIEIEGQPAFSNDALRPGRRGRWVRLHGLEDKPVSVAFKLAAGTQAAATMYELSALPEDEELARLASARGPEIRTIQTGDIAIVRGRIDLGHPPAAP